MSLLSDPSTALLLSLQVVSGTLAVAFIFASVLIFSNHRKDPDCPSSLLISFVDIIDTFTSPFSRWKKSSSGRLVLYLGVASTSVFWLTFVLGVDPELPQLPASPQ